MRLRLVGLLASILVLAPSLSASADQKDRDAQLKQAFDDLKAEVVVLERQIRSMQESMDRNSGQMSTLITQIVDNVTAIKQAQSRSIEASSSAINQATSLGEQLNATNDRIERLSEQIADLRKFVESMPKLPTFTTITPGNPDQLFAAAYSDYSRGNYDLAVSEFRQYVESYPSSEMADNAQYWIGECFFAKKKYDEAIVEFDAVVSKFPKGDKVPAARYKKGLTLMEQGKTDDARAEFTAIIRLYKNSNEAVLARQQLGER